MTQWDYDMSNEMPTRNISDVNVSDPLMLRWMNVGLCVPYADPTVIK
jgi:hypothetical protein